MIFLSASLFYGPFPWGSPDRAPDRGGPQGSLAGLPDPLLRAAGGPRQLPTSLGWARLACFLSLIWLDLAWLRLGFRVDLA